MTANEIDRGGRPRLYDEAELIARIRADEDFALIEAALVEHSSHPTWASGCVEWLWRKRLGDPNGGKTPRMATRYREMLAEIPHDPLKPPGGRRRALRELASQRGSADFVLLAGGALAGAVALAVLSPSAAAQAIAALLPPIMPVMSTCLGLHGTRADGEPRPHDTFRPRRDRADQAAQVQVRPLSRPEALGRDRRVLHG